MLIVSSNKKSEFTSKIDIQTPKYKYNQNNSIKFEIESTKSSLCDYCNAFILITRCIAVTADSDTDAAFKNCA